MVALRWGHEVGAAFLSNSLAPAFIPLRLGQSRGQTSRLNSLHFQKTTRKVIPVPGLDAPSPFTPGLAPHRLRSSNKPSSHEAAAGPRPVGAPALPLGPARPGAPEARGHEPAAPGTRPCGRCAGPGGGGRRPGAAGGDGSAPRGSDGGGAARAGSRGRGRLSPARLPPVAASAIPALGTAPGGRPRARSGFQEAGGGAFQPRLAVAEAPRAPSGPARPPARPPRAPAPPGSGGGRPCTCRALQVAARALRRGPRQRCAARPEGAGEAGRPPSQPHLTARRRQDCGAAGWRPASGNLLVPDCARGVDGAAPARLSAARAGPAPPGLHVPGASAAPGGCRELRAGVRGRLDPRGGGKTRGIGRGAGGGYLAGPGVFRDPGAQPRRGSETSGPHAPWGPGAFGEGRAGLALTCGGTPERGGFRGWASQAENALTAAGSGERRKGPPPGRWGSSARSARGRGYARAGKASTRCRGRADAGGAPAGRRGGRGEPARGARAPGARHRPPPFGPESPPQVGNSSTFADRIRPGP